MAGSFNTSNGNTTAKFEYTTTTAKMQNVVGDAANYLFNRDYGDHGTEESPIVFEDLTNQQKLDLVDDYLKQVVIDAANTYKSLAAQELARNTEEENKYSL